MRHERSCSDIMERLEAFHDGELTIDERIDVQHHLGECEVCNQVATEISLLGSGLRDIAAAIAEHDTTDPSRISAHVVEHLRVEEQFSMRAQVADWFSDMHLVWAGLGASVAMLICVVGSASVLHAANQERPNSMARTISELASQGSNDNPVRLNSSMRVPRAVTDAIEMPEKDAQYTLAAVVSREGHVQGVEMVDQASHPGANAMLIEAYRTRFAPATSRGDAVAVSLVWLVANTTVRSPHDPMEALRQALRLHNSPAPIPTPTFPAEAEVPEASAAPPPTAMVAAEGL
jgi:predicted anti-sigma-YlaC factor YlaD